MSNAEINEERVNLKDIVDISEDEFKKQISAWIDERGISRKLQSKLRADLFEQFNRTKLGRQMTEQHQQAHRIVLSPLILVLNTLVAEFLFIEDCHFTLSVFTNEVPYKNTLPDFEVTPPRQLFRFSNSELGDIFEAIGISKQNEQIAREFYLNGQYVVNKSLLYCIIKTLITQINRQNGKREKISKKVESKPAKPKPSTSSAVVQSTSSQQSSPPPSRSDKKSDSRGLSRIGGEHLQISSRYFKYLNRYLEILSNRINDMSKSLAEKHVGNKYRRISIDSSSQEESLRKDLRKIIQNINKLTKSQRKSKRFSDVLNSIERLSASVEKCSGKLGDLLTMVNVQSKVNEVIEKKSNDKMDRFSEMDYGSWLKELKTSEHGKKFIDRLEASLQKTMEKERENLDKLYEEKTNNYRMLIRLHYKQKYDNNKNETEIGGRIEKDDSSPIDKITPDNTEKAMAESLAARALEKEQHVDNIVQTAKSRLQQLERESEDLDQSFQAYLRRQQILKQQMNCDASKIWENYKISKTALAQFQTTDEKPSSDSVHRMKLNDSRTADQVFSSTFYDDVDIEEVLKDLNEIRQLKSPRFDKTDAFPKDKLLPLKSLRNQFDPLTIRKEPQFDPLTIRKEPLFVAHAKIQHQEKAVEIPPKAESRPIITESVKTKVIETAPEYIGPIRPQQNGIANRRAEIKLPEEKPETVLAAAINGRKVELKENGLKSPKSLKSPISPKSPTSPIISPKEDVNFGRLNESKTQPNGLVNGHKIVEVQKVPKIEKPPEDKKDLATKGKLELENLISPSKVNELNKTIEAKFNDVPKLPVAIANGFSHAPKAITNGISSKLAPFVSRISDSESGDAESDQISIGQQRLVKSPDFWI